MKICFACSEVLWPWSRTIDVHGKDAHKKCAKVWGAGYQTAWMYVTDLYQKKGLALPAELVEQKLGKMKKKADVTQ